MMLVINGLKFAKNKREFVESLFISGGTCNGYYKKHSQKTVVLYDMQNKPMAWIKREAPDHAFAGTAADYNGRVRFAWGMASYTEEALGIQEVSYYDKCALLSAALDSVGV